MKKRMLAVLVAGAMVLGFTGCSSSSTTQESTSTTTQASESSEEKIKVGIIQLIDNGAFEDMREGFIAQLAAKGYDESKIEIDYKNAQGDGTNLNTIAQEMVSSEMDIIAAIATPSAQAVVNLETDIPVVFISVSDPVGAGVITEMGSPDKNATGTSNAIPVNEIIDLSNKLTPEVESFGFLYCTSEVNSVSTVTNTKAYLDSIGVKYEEAVVTNSSEVQQATQSLIGKVDAIFVPNDSVIQSAMPLVSEIANEEKLPVYASSATTVESGAFATIAISDTQIGEISADMAIEILEGTPIEEVPAVVVPVSDTVINASVAEALGIEFSDEVKESAVFIGGEQ